MKFAILIAACLIWLAEIYFGKTISRKFQSRIDIFDIYILRREEEPTLFWGLIGFQLFILLIGAYICVMFE